jgi:uncharacterized protein (TIGR00730 family)
MTINEQIAALLRSFEDNRLSDVDTERAIAYARDLQRGLATIRTFPQGVAIFGSARLDHNSLYYKMAERLGEKLAKHGHTVVTGGGPGIMEAANKGAFEVGGRSVGLNIKLAHEQHPNPYLTEMFEFHYFFARKVMLLFSTKVYVLFPGGFGTLDELSEVLVLMQEKKMPKMPVFLMGKDFWTPLEKFVVNRMEPLGTVGPNDKKIFHITNEIDDVVKAADTIGHTSTNDNIYENFSGYL